SGITHPINSTNETTVVASGSVEAGATVKVTATDQGGAHSVGPVTATITGTTWSATLDVSSLNDGTLTFTATVTDSQNNTSSQTQTATKTPTATAVSISTVPASINIANVSNTTVTGTPTPGSTVTVVASDAGNLHVTSPVTATVAADGTWTATGINVND